MHTTYTPSQIAAEALRVANEFNAKHGGTYLAPTRHTDDSVSIGDLKRLAESQPGPYLAASAFQQAKGRNPTRGETIATGRLLAALGIQRRKDGAATLWLLDAEALRRLS